MSTSITYDGTVKSWDETAKTGIITSSEGIDYTVAADDLKELTNLEVDQNVHFNVDVKRAVNVQESAPT